MWYSGQWYSARRVRNAADLWQILDPEHNPLPGTYVGAVAHAHVKALDAARAAGL